MTYKNFKVETDADGIALVTWDTPGRSMNVLDETSVNELEAIVKATSADAALKGVVITSGKEALSAGADLSMLQGMSRAYAEMLKDKGEVAANQMLFDQSRRFSQLFRSIETSGKPWVAAINGTALGGGFEAASIRLRSTPPTPPIASTSKRAPISWPTIYYHSICHRLRRAVDIDTAIV